MFGQKFLSQNHAMKRVKTTEKYILLPVEESEGIAHIRVIKDNQVVKEFNCKLSVNKTDYTVPLDSKVLYFLDAFNLCEDKVRVTACAHVPPSLSIVMVLLHHQFVCLLCIAIVKC